MTPFSDLNWKQKSYSCFLINLEKTCWSYCGIKWQNWRKKRNLAGSSKTILSASCITFGDLINDFDYFVWHLGENTIEFGNKINKMVGEKNAIWIWLVYSTGNSFNPNFQKSFLGTNIKTQRFEMCCKAFIGTIKLKRHLFRNTLTSCGNL